MINPTEVQYAPSLSMDSICHIRDTVDGKDAKEKTIIALIFVHGSWNAPRKNTSTQQQSWSQTFLQTLLASSSSQANNSDKIFVAGTLQVDQDDETMACCLGDDGFHDSADSANHYNIPCPPATLPALAVAVQTPSQSHARVQYLSDITSSELLSQMNALNPHFANSDPFYLERGTGIAVLSHNELTASIGSVVNDLLTQTVISTMSNSRKKDDDDDAKAKTNNNNSSMHSKKRLIAPVDRTIGNKQQESSSANTEDGTSDAIRIFVAGDRSSVGKSSVCLGLIGTLIDKFGYAPSSLAYIKPATQCEAPQLVQAYCESKGIACRAVGPLVYYKGFTRAFLAGETGQTTEELLAECGQAVDEIAQGKRIVLVDGVGFPAVGSICGTDNASVAKACGYPTAKLSGDTVHRRPPGVIIVGGSGVGAAVDAFNLNATYFEMGKVPVMGGIFNKLSTEGYYSLENCKQQLTTYFQQNEYQQQRDRVAFGFVPLFDGLGDDDAIKHVDEFIQMFSEHVDIPTILEKATRLKQQYSEGDSMDIDPPIATAKTLASHSAPLKKRFKSNGTASAMLSRADIERSAAGQGAATA